MGNLTSRWPAQEPPRGFAEGTVEAILRTGVQPVARRERRRWVTVLALAAALAAGTSWAMIHRGGSDGGASREHTMVVRGRAPAGATGSEVTGLLRHAPPRDSSTARAIAPRAVPSPSASAPVPAASSGRRPVLVPRCECGPATVMCTCVQ